MPLRYSGAAENQAAAGQSEGWGLERISQTITAAVGWPFYSLVPRVEGLIAWYNQPLMPMPAGLQAAFDTYRQSHTWGNLAALLAQMSCCPLRASAEVSNAFWTFIQVALSYDEKGICGSSQNLSRAEKMFLLRDEIKEDVVLLEQELARKKELEVLCQEYQIQGKQQLLEEAQKESEECLTAIANHEAGLAEMKRLYRIFKREDLIHCGIEVKKLSVQSLKQWVKYFGGCPVSLLERVIRLRAEAEAEAGAGAGAGLQSAESELGLWMILQKDIFETEKQEQEQREKECLRELALLRQEAEELHAKIEVSAEGENEHSQQASALLNVALQECISAARDKLSEVPAIALECQLHVAYERRRGDQAHTPRARMLMLGAQGGLAALLGSVQAVVDSVYPPSPILSASKELMLTRPMSEVESHQSPNTVSKVLKCGERENPANDPWWYRVSQIYTPRHLQGVYVKEVPFSSVPPPVAKKSPEDRREHRQRVREAVKAGRFNKQSSQFLTETAEQAQPGTVVESQLMESPYEAEQDGTSSALEKPPVTSPVSLREALRQEGGLLVSAWDCSIAILDSIGFPGAEAAEIPLEQEASQENCEVVVLEEACLEEEEPTAESQAKAKHVEAMLSEVLLSLRRQDTAITSALPLSTTTASIITQETDSQSQSAFHQRGKRGLEDPVSPPHVLSGNIRSEDNPDILAPIKHLLAAPVERYDPNGTPLPPLSRLRKLVTALSQLISASSQEDRSVIEESVQAFGRAFLARNSEFAQGFSGMRSFLDVSIINDKDVLSNHELQQAFGGINLFDANVQDISAIRYGAIYAYMLCKYYPEYGVNWSLPPQILGKAFAVMLLKDSYESVVRISGGVEQLSEFERLIKEAGKETPFKSLLGEEALRPLFSEQAVELQRTMSFGFEDEAAVCAFKSHLMSLAMLEGTPEGFLKGRKILEKMIDVSNHPDVLMGHRNHMAMVYANRRWQDPVFPGEADSFFLEYPSLPPKMTVEGFFNSFIANAEVPLLLNMNEPGTDNPHLVTVIPISHPADSSQKMYVLFDANIGLMPCLNLKSLKYVFEKSVSQGTGQGLVTFRGKSLLSKYVDLKARFLTPDVAKFLLDYVPPPDSDAPSVRSYLTQPMELLQARFLGDVGNDWGSVIPKKEPLFNAFLRNSQKSVAFAAVVDDPMEGASSRGQGMVVGEDVKGLLEVVRQGINHYEDPHYSERFSASITAEQVEILRSSLHLEDFGHAMQALGLFPDDFKPEAGRTHALDDRIRSTVRMMGESLLSANAEASGLQKSSVKSYPDYILKGTFKFKPPGGPRSRDILKEVRSYLKAGSSRVTEDGSVKSSAELWRDLTQKIMQCVGNEGTYAEDILLQKVNKFGHAYLLQDAKFMAGYAQYLSEFDNLDAAALKRNFENPVRDLDLKRSFFAHDMNSRADAVRLHQEKMSVIYAWILSKNYPEYGLGVEIAPEVLGKAFASLQMDNIWEEHLMQKGVYPNHHLKALNAAVPSDSAFVRHLGNKASPILKTQLETLTRGLQNHYGGSAFCYLQSQVLALMAHQDSSLGGFLAARERFLAFSQLAEEPPEVLNRALMSILYANIDISDQKVLVPGDFIKKPIYMLGDAIPHFNALHQRLAEAKHPVMLIVAYPDGSSHAISVSKFLDAETGQKIQVVVDSNVGFVPCHNREQLALALDPSLRAQENRNMGSFFWDDLSSTLQSQWFKEMGISVYAQEQTPKVMEQIRVLKSRDGFSVEDFATKPLSQMQSDSSSDVTVEWGSIIRGSNPWREGAISRKSRLRVLYDRLRGKRVQEPNVLKKVSTQIAPVLSDEALRVMQEQMHFSDFEEAVKALGVEKSQLNRVSQSQGQGLDLNAEDNVAQRLGGILEASVGLEGAVGDIEKVAVGAAATQEMLSLEGDFEQVKGEELGKSLLKMLSSVGSEDIVVAARVQTDPSGQVQLDPQDVKSLFEGKLQVPEGLGLGARTGLDDFALASGLLTPEEVMQIRTKGSGITEQDLKAVHVEAIELVSKMEALDKELESSLKASGVNSAEWEINQGKFNPGQSHEFIELRSLSQTGVDGGAVTKRVYLQRSLSQGMTEVMSKVKDTAQRTLGSSGAAAYTKGVGGYAKVMGAISFANLISESGRLGEQSQMAKLTFGLKVTDLGVDVVANVVGMANKVVKVTVGPIGQLSQASRIAGKISLGVSMVVNIAEICVHSYALATAQSGFDARIAKLNLGFSIANTALMAISASLPILAPLTVTLQLFLAQLQQFLMEREILAETIERSYQPWSEEIKALRKLMESSPNIEYDPKNGHIIVVSDRVPSYKIVVTAGGNIEILRDGRALSAEILRTIRRETPGYKVKYYVPEVGSGGRPLPEPAKRILSDVAAFSNGLQSSRNYPYLKFARGTFSKAKYVADNLGPCLGLKEGYTHSLEKAVLEEREKLVQRIATLKQEISEGILEVERAKKTIVELEARWARSGHSAWLDGIIRADGIWREGALKIIESKKRQLSAAEIELQTRVSVDFNLQESNRLLTVVFHSHPKVRYTEDHVYDFRSTAWYGAVHDLTVQDPDVLYLDKCNADRAPGKHYWRARAFAVAAKIPRQYATSEKRELLEGRTFAYSLHGVPAGKIDTHPSGVGRYLSHESIYDLENFHRIPQGVRLLPSETRYELRMCHPPVSYQFLADTAAGGFPEYFGFKTGYPVKNEPGSSYITKKYLLAEPCQDTQLGLGVGTWYFLEDEVSDAAVGIYIVTPFCNMAQAASIYFQAHEGMPGVFLGVQKQSLKIIKKSAKLRPLTVNVQLSIQNRDTMFNIFMDLEGRKYEINYLWSLPYQSLQMSSLAMNHAVSVVANMKSGMQPDAFSAGGFPILQLSFENFDLPGIDKRLLEGKGLYLPHYRWKDALETAPPGMVVPIIWFKETSKAVKEIISRMELYAIEDITQAEVPEDIAEKIFPRYDRDISQAAPYIFYFFDSKERALVVQYGDHPIREKDITYCPAGHSPHEVAWGDKKRLTCTPINMQNTDTGTNALLDIRRLVGDYKEIMRAAQVESLGVDLQANQKIKLVSGKEMGVYEAIQHGHMSLFEYIQYRLGHKAGVPYAAIAGLLFRPQTYPAPRSQQEIAEMKAQESSNVQPASGLLWMAKTEQAPTVLSLVPVEWQSYKDDIHTLAEVPGQDRVLYSRRLGLKTPGYQLRVDQELVQRIASVQKASGFQYSVNGNIAFGDKDALPSVEDRDHYQLFSVANTRGKTLMEVEAALMSSEPPAVPEGLFPIPVPVLPMTTLLKVQNQPGLEGVFCTTATGVTFYMSYDQSVRQLLQVGSAFFLGHNLDPRDSEEVITAYENAVAGYGEPMLNYIPMAMLDDQTMVVVVKASREVLFVPAGPLRGESQYQQRVIARYYGSCGGTSLTVEVPEQKLLFVVNKAHHQRLAHVVHTMAYVFLERDYDNVYLQLPPRQGTAETRSLPPLEARQLYLLSVAGKSSDLLQISPQVQPSLSVIEIRMPVAAGFVAQRISINTLGAKSQFPSLAAIRTTIFAQLGKPSVLAIDVLRGDVVSGGKPSYLRIMIRDGLNQAERLNESCEGVLTIDCRTYSVSEINAWLETAARVNLDEVMLNEED